MVSVNGKSFDISSKLDSVLNKALKDNTFNEAEVKEIISSATTYTDSLFIQEMENLSEKNIPISLDLDKPEQNFNLYDSLNHIENDAISNVFVNGNSFNVSQNLKNILEKSLSDNKLNLEEVQNIIKNCSSPEEKLLLEELRNNIANNIPLNIEFNVEQVPEMETLPDLGIVPRDPIDLTSPPLSLMNPSEMSPVQQSSNIVLSNLISKLKSYSGNSLGKEIEKAIQNKDVRNSLIKSFNLDSPQNIKSLKAAMYTEAGNGKEDTFGVGAVILNRTLSLNLLNLVNGSNKIYSIDRVVREKNQFQIVRNGRYDRELRSNQGKIDSGIVNNLLNGHIISPAGKDYSKMYYFQTADQAQYGRKISLSTPNGHLFSYGYDKKALPYVTNNMMAYNQDKAGSRFI